MNVFDIAVDLIFKRAKKVGFITENEILDITEKHTVSLADIERIFSLLQSKSIIIRDSISDNIISKTNEAKSYLSEKAKIDYEKIFDTVIKIEPDLTNYINHLKTILPPRRGEERDLIYQAKKGNKYAQERLVSIFLKVAVRYALYYHKRYGFHLSDSIQDATVGVMIAIDKMPITSEYKFSTYAPNWMRQNMFRNNNSFCNYFYIPTHLKTKLYKLVDILNEYEAYSINSLSTHQEFVKTISMIISESTKTTEYYLSLLEPILSIENKLLYSDHNLFMDSTIDSIMQSQLKTAIREAILPLKKQYREVMIERYGLVSRKPKTLEEVGQVFNLTRERIRQIESKAISIINLSEHSEKLRSFH